jgi:hypothetical protein
MKLRIFVASALLVAIAACGGKSGTIALSVVTSPTSDPFANAAQVRVTIGTLTTMTTPVSMGHFTLDLPVTPNSAGTAPVTVEALDGSGNVIAWGKSPPIPLPPQDQGPYNVWVAPPQTILAGPTTSSFASPRSEMAATYVNGLGVVYAGGRDPNGTPLNSASVFFIYGMQMVDVSPLVQARAGAVMAPTFSTNNGTTTASRAVVFGGSQANGLGQTGMPLATAEVFDPSGAMGAWLPVTAAMNVDAQAYPAATVVGTTMITAGGVDGAGPTTTSNLINLDDAAVALTPTPGMLVAPVTGATMAPVGTDGALVFGGLQPGITTPVAQRFIGQAFTDYSAGFTGVTSRVNSSSVVLPDGSGRILILGGKHGSTVYADGLVVTPGGTAQVTDVPSLLSSPREGQTATVVGGNILVCGGADATGLLLPSCDLLDGTAVTRIATLPTGIARRGATAFTLETGPVVIAGGTGTDGMPIAAVELYTPAEM